MTTYLVSTYARRKHDMSRDIIHVAQSLSVIKLLPFKSSFKDLVINPAHSS